MSHFLRSTAVALVGCTLALGLAGCDAQAGADEMVLVIGAVEGAPFVGPSQIQAYVDRIDEVGDRLTVIIADGAPYVVGDWSLTALPEHPQDRADELDDIRADILSVASTSIALSPESDLTEAIRLAERSFTPAEGSKTLVMLTPMLQTTGALSMIEGRFGQPVGDLIDFAEQNGALAALGGSVAVEVPRLGLVEAPQPTLDSRSVDHLREIWAEYFSRSDAKSVSFASGSLTQRPQDAELPHVTPVAIDRVVAECAVALDAASISFTVGTADFADPTAARAALERAAQDLAGCAGDYLVEGSASSEGDEAANEQLSGQRSRAVAGELSGLLSVSAAAIRTVAWGENWPCRVVDVDAAGVVSEASAASNRVVVVSRGVEPGTC